MQKSDGHFGYPMDDTYTHMAIAKHFATDGVWGVTRYSFSSSTSSPLYTLLLAGTFWLTGVHEWGPLVLNLAFAGLLLFACEVSLRHAKLAPRQILYVMLGLVIAIPLPVLVLGGMEHVLHAALTLIFMHNFAQWMAGGGVSGGRFAAWLALAPLLVTARYEGAFTIFIAAALLARRGRWGHSAALCIMGAAPLCIYGWVAWRHGWFPVPNSLLVKANAPVNGSSGATLILGALVNALRAPHLVGLVVAALALLFLSRRYRRDIWSYSGIALQLFLGTAILHVMFARVGWYFRYESYLVALGIVACMAHLVSLDLRVVWAAWQRPLAVLGAGLCLALIGRAAIAFYISPDSMRNVYQQQYQMGLFVQRYFNGAPVVLNDIGAVSFLSDARVLDMIGLADMEAARAHFRHTYSPEWVGSWAQRNAAKIAIVYPDAGPPSEWLVAGSWTVPANRILHGATVNFYAVAPGEMTDLVRNLKDFNSRLPAGVTWSGY